jgi:dTDP-4-dehydrorhamnose 3,5-epimerase
MIDVPGAERDAKRATLAPDAVRDRQTVTAAGEPVQAFPEGVVLRDLKTHTDDRGTVFELYDPRWEVHSAPLAYSYCFTIRPGKVKGWGVHDRHDDRYTLLYGEANVVLYDDRADSATYRTITEVVLSEHRRQLLTIPVGVWHATQNLAERDVVMVNFPTALYDHANPDKYRLPLDTDHIPYRFDSTRAGW